MAGLSNVISIEAGVTHIIALKKDQTVWTVGSNWYGELGVGTINARNVPTPIPNLTSITAVSAGTVSVNPSARWSSHTLALRADGVVWAWGSNGYGQLGQGTIGYGLSSSTPLQVQNLTSATAVAGGADHSLALRQDGTVWAWGRNDYGELGNASSISSGAPLQVVALDSVSAIAAGYAHSLALKKDGTVWAWGYNDSGQLGDGSTTDRTTPIQVLGLTTVIAIATGSNHSLALKQDGTVWAWGTNYLGHLGDGSVTQRNAPVQVANLQNVRSIAAGGSHTMAVQQDGTVWTWGWNSSGELGDGTLNTRYTPVKVTNLTNVNGIAAGNVHSLALTPQGAVWSWGSNLYGQLGDATLAGRQSAVLMLNETVDDALDLIPEVPNIIPADQLPSFLVQVAKAANVTTTVKYNPTDLNQTGSVYVVAYLRPDSPLLLPSVNPTSKITGGILSKDSGCPVNFTGTVPAVLTRGGWKQTDCITPTLPLYTGTLDVANNTFGMYDSNKFDQTKDNGLFCVAYAGASTTSAKGLIRSVVSGVDANLNICPPIQIGAPADTVAPSIPLNITATAAGPGQVNLSWIAATDNTAVVHYNIYRGTTLIATLDNLTSYIDSSPQASTAYSYSVMACDAAANCSGQSTPVQTNTPALPSVTLGAGWNLVGNGGSTTMNVPSLFGDASKIYSLWKWVKVGSAPNVIYPAWAFYTPGQADSGAAYAASKGYDTFTSIASGEGFWVNAKLPFNVPMTAPAWILSSVFAPNQSKALTPGWSLIATGEAQTASAFNKSMGTTPPAPGAIPINLTSLWAWQNSTQRWYLYAPSLDASGGLTAYLSEKNFLDFGSVSFAPTTGFWVNR